MAESLVFRREWVVQISKLLAAEIRLPDADAIPRVATTLLNMKPEAYIPQFLAIGPYHHSRLEKDFDATCAERKISTAEVYKGMSAATLSGTLRKYGKSFDDIVERMKGMQPQIERFYHWPTSTAIEYSQNFSLMMAVDSSFLLRFLSSQIRFFDKQAPQERLDIEMIELCAVYSDCIQNDIVKLENQIPLSVLEGVFEKVKEALRFDGNFNHLLQKTCHRFSPFWTPEIADNEYERINNGAVPNEPHFLACVHLFISGFLNMQRIIGEDQTLCQKLKENLQNLVILVCRVLPTLPILERQFLQRFSAGQLARNGIKFKSFSKLGYHIGLNKYSGTLCLPKIRVSELGTEVFLRNMLALEFNDACRPKCVTHYVTLMGSLIQSADDVRVLVDGHVIIRDPFTTLTDECIVKLWNNVRQPFVGGGVPPPDEVTKLYSALEKLYYTTKIKRTIWGIIDFVSSWKFMAPLGVFLGLTMTAIQTYCNLYQLYNNKH